MLTTLVLAATLAQPLPPLRRFDAGAFTLELPVTWRATSASGTRRFDSSSGNAYVLVDTSTVEAPDLTPEACLTRILAKFTGASTKKLAVGDMPGARISAWNTSPNAEQTMITETYVACDGRQAFSILFFLPLAERVYWMKISGNAIASIQRKPR